MFTGVLQKDLTSIRFGPYDGYSAAHTVLFTAKFHQKSCSRMFLVHFSSNGRLAIKVISFAMKGNRGDAQE